MTASEPPSDAVMKVAMDAATAQFQRMPTSNPWNYARAVVDVLRAAGMIVEDLPPSTVWGAGPPGLRRDGAADG